MADMKSKGGSIIHNAPAMPQETGHSSPQNVAVGSGSRPTRSKFEIPTSAPSNAHTQGREVPGWLGGGKTKALEQ